jgi:hypothetical protein
MSNIVFGRFLQQISLFQNNSKDVKIYKFRHQSTHANRRQTQRSKPTQAAVCVSANDGGNQRRKKNRKKMTSPPAFGKSEKRFIEKRSGNFFFQYHGGIIKPP